MKDKGITLQKEALDITTAILRKHLPSSCKVWIFGSRAKGLARRFSDLDLAIDANQTPLPQKTMALLLDDFEESDLPYKVDIIDWNCISNDFRLIIQKEKKRLKF